MNRFSQFKTSELDLIRDGLEMKKNFIETGDPILGAVDMYRQERFTRIRLLEEDQKKLIFKIQDLLNEIEKL